MGDETTAKTALQYSLSDGLPELQLVRAENVSLGRVVRWLILPGKLDFDLFTYTNTAGKYGLKPQKKTTFSLQIPRLLTIEEKFEGLEEEFREE